MTMLILTTTLCEWGNKEIEAMKLHTTLASSQILQWIENGLVKLEA